MKAMRGFALLELLIIVTIIGLLALLAAHASLFSSAAPAQVQQGNDAIQQAQHATQQFDAAANREQTSTDEP